VTVYELGRIEIPNAVCLSGHPTNDKLLLIADETGIYEFSKITGRYLILPATCKHVFGDYYHYVVQAIHNL